VKIDNFRYLRHLAPRSLIQNSATSLRSKKLRASGGGGLRHPDSLTRAYAPGPPLSSPKYLLFPPNLGCNKTLVRSRLSDCYKKVYRPVGLSCAWYVL